MVDSVITLFESTETNFTSNGLGSLTDAISCIVTEERNGVFELEMTYPVDGLHANDLIGYYDEDGKYVSSLRRIIYCKTSVLNSKQPFRIYAVSKPINGQVTINAEHISYDLSGIPVTPFTVQNPAEAFLYLKNNSAISHNFTFWTSRNGNSTMSFAVPKSLRSLLGGEDGSVLDHYGGEYEFDKFEVKLHQHRGEDRGVTIRYGKNLTDLKQEENCANVYTGVYPYWYREGDEEESSGLVEVAGKIIDVEGNFNFRRILTLDLTSEFDDKPTPEDLANRCKSYITENNIGVPKVNLEVSFLQLSQSEEYADKALFENVYLCDTVSVYFPELGVTNSKVKCVKTVFNVLKDRYDSIELGEPSSNLANTVAGQGQTIKTEVDGMRTFMELAITAATSKITSGLGGYVVMHHSGASDAKSGYPDEILICSTSPDIRVAQGMWRWNKEGLAYSPYGYNGPFNKVAITNDGKLLAQNITVEGLEVGSNVTMGPNAVIAWDKVTGGADALNSAIQPINTKLDASVQALSGEIATKITAQDVTTLAINAGQIKSGILEVGVSPDPTHGVPGAIRLYTIRKDANGNPVRDGAGNIIVDQIGKWDDGGIDAKQGTIGGFTIENTNVLRTKLRNGTVARLTGEGANYRMWEDSAHHGTEVYPFITLGNTDSELPDSELTIGYDSDRHGVIYADIIRATDIEVRRENKWVGIRDYINRDY